MGTGDTHDRGELEPLVAYLHLPRHASAPTRAVLEGHIRSFAEREGFRLHRVLAGTENPPHCDDGDGSADRSDAAAVRDLIDCVQTDGIRKVLVVGPARQALLALHRIRGVRILTLAQVRPSDESPSAQTSLAAPGIATPPPEGGTGR